MMNGAKAIAKKYNEVSLILRIVVGLVIGAVLALAVPGAGWVGELGSLFVGALKGIAPVLVFVIVTERGWRIENIDATILCQRPKLAPHIPAMRAKLAEAFGMPVDAVSVKATTEEHLGFTGEGLGIAAHAVALIEAV